MWILLFLVLFIVGIEWFINSRKFGQLPNGAYRARIMQSPNYRDKRFRNLSFTPDLAQGETLPKVLKKFLFDKSKRAKPAQKMPSQKTDLKALQPSENVLVWFGHSSYFLQVDGKTFLVDPVLSGSASPIAATTRSFPGSDVYAAADLPEIDCLLISHDHWDHLDYPTVMALKPKIRQVITGLGTGAHFRRWGYTQDVIEKDWDETLDLGDGFTIDTTPARHFSGRGFKRNQALWLSFVLRTPNFSLFLGGDSGYDSHFADIGNQFGPFDLAIVECGQYNESWKNIHLMPNEMIPVAQDLKAKILMPVHWGKFSLALHAWDEPIALVTEAAKKANLPLMSPMIGEKVNLDKPQIDNDWWRTVG